MTMTDEIADAARLMRVIDAVVFELERQGVAEVVADLGFNATEMAKAAIRAADGVVIPFRGLPSA
ncbi:hypothetical protein J4G48_0040420 [Bradyrhizobium barranii subsp. apii]|uniref:hypothetical protein n=1 Tax=Bradyrhizobium barranii TaxID=2992140 RepID=UPI001AA10BC1|nr:hypothetical protein [Bradyrhizobium barranii]UPT95422.1 hypothetical protein J4G48_0040420 [Bradyrhizobium barranii subsp. apii]